MARTAGKRVAKSTTTATPVNTIATTSPSNIPEPFKSLPPSLRAVVAKLPTTHVYAFHIDHTPRSLKQRVYVIPILLNLVITFGLLWRVYYAAPVYLQQIITIFGYDTAYKVDPSQMSLQNIMSTVGDRTFLLMFDYALFGLLGSWPWEFVFGSKYSRYTGAAAWRWTLGFREKEIIVRAGRKWDQALLRERDDEGEKDKSGKWTLDEELSLKFKVEAGLRRSYTAKTGYLLLDKDWDLDYKAMIDMHMLVNSGTVKMEDLDHIVLVYHQKQWLLWRVHDEAAETQRVAATAEEDSTLRTFRDKLVALRVEDVFFRWIEMVQYESSLPGGFTQGKQAEAMRELKRLLTDRGVDYAKFWTDIGGQDGVPGLSQHSS